MHVGKLIVIADGDVIIWRSEGIVSFGDHTIHELLYGYRIGEGGLWEMLTKEDVTPERLRMARMVVYLRLGGTLIPTRAKKDKTITWVRLASIDRDGELTFLTNGPPLQRPH